jgi:hypothetical protein
VVEALLRQELAEVHVVCGRWLAWYREKRLPLDDPRFPGDWLPLGRAGGVS